MTGGVAPFHYLVELRLPLDDGGGGLLGPAPWPAHLSHHLQVPKVMLASYFRLQQPIIIKRVGVQRMNAFFVHEAHSGKI